MKIKFVMFTFESVESKKKLKIKFVKIRNCCFIFFLKLSLKVSQQYASKYR